MCRYPIPANLRPSEKRRFCSPPLQNSWVTLTISQGHSHLDGGFKIWHAQGLKKLGDLFDGQTLLSFAQPQQRYGLLKSEFFRYLQIRQFITKDTTLLTNSSASQVERALSLQFSKKHISIFYDTLNSNSSSTSLATKQSWENDFGTPIDGGLAVNVGLHKGDFYLQSN